MKRDQEGSETGERSKLGQGSNTIRDLRAIVAEEGVRGLFRGATVRMGYLTVGGFAFFGVYEQSKSFIARQLAD